MPALAISNLLFVLMFFSGSNSYGWIPLVCVISAMSFQTIGVLVVIQLLLAESFPTEIRSYACGICGAATALNTFGATKLFPILQENMGFHGTFWLYGSVMASCTVFGAFSIPENRGQSLVKTEDKFQINKALAFAVNEAFAVNDMTKL